jgi:hypothetical protein
MLGGPDADPTAQLSETTIKIWDMLDSGWEGAIDWFKRNGEGPQGPKEVEGEV